MCIRDSITVGPLVNLWGFGPEPRQDRIPPEDEIRRARERVGFKRLHARAEPPALRKERADLYVDLSALAKGYGVDRLAELADGAGVGNYLVSIGGDLSAKGHNGQGQPWTAAIERPTPGQRAVERLIRIGDRAVSTAGDYRNFFEQDGRRYSHIIDPRSGWPVPQTVASVTVIDRLDLNADAADTALMAAGAEAGFRLAAERGIAAFFIPVSYTHLDVYKRQIQTLVNQFFSGALADFVLVALLSIPLSGADIILITTGTLLGRDVIVHGLRAVGRAPDEAAQVWIIRGCMVLAAVLATGFALRLQAIIPSLLIAYKVFSIGIVPLLFLSLLSIRQGLATAVAGPTNRLVAVYLLIASLGVLLVELKFVPLALPNYNLYLLLGNTLLLLLLLRLGGHRFRAVATPR